MEPEEILKNKTQSGGAINDETSKPSSLDYLPAKQACGCVPTPWKRTSMLERVPFESEKPFFKVLMRPSYVGSHTSHIVSFLVYDLLCTPYVLQTTSIALW